MTVGTSLYAYILRILSLLYKYLIYFRYVYPQPGPRTKPKPDDRIVNQWLDVAELNPLPSLIFNHDLF